MTIFFRARCPATMKRNLTRCAIRCTHDNFIISYKHDTHTRCEIFKEKISKRVKSKLPSQINRDNIMSYVSWHVYPPIASVADQYNTNSRSFNERDASIRFIAPICISYKHAGSNYRNLVVIYSRCDIKISFITLAGKKFARETSGKRSGVNYTICYFRIGASMIDKFYKMLSLIQQSLRDGSIISCR